eukprot:3969058-Amphidinium_carterae.1
MASCAVLVHAAGTRAPVPRQCAHASVTRGCKASETGTPYPTRQEELSEKRQQDEQPILTCLASCFVCVVCRVLRVVWLFGCLVVGCLVVVVVVGGGGGGGVEDSPMVLLEF